MNILGYKMEIRKTKLGLHSGELAGRGGGEEGGLHVLYVMAVCR